MSRAIRFEPEAHEELYAATKWYEEQRPNLGAELVEAIDAALERVAEAPRSFPIVTEPPIVRRALVPGFPYAIVYTETDDGAVFIVAIAHVRRRPLYWTRRVHAQPSKP